MKIRLPPIRSVMRCEGQSGVISRRAVVVEGRWVARRESGGRKMVMVKVGDGGEKVKYSGNEENKECEWQGRRKWNS